MTAGVRTIDKESVFNSWYSETIAQIYDLCCDYASIEPIEEEEVRDLSQEVYARVWEQIDSFNGDSEFATWAYRVAVNTLKNIASARERRGLCCEEFADDTCLPCGCITTATREKYEEVWEAIEKLRGVNKPIMEMYADGYTQAEIATTLGLAGGQVRGRVQRCRERIRRMVGEEAMA